MTNQAELYHQVSSGQHQCGLTLIEMAQPESGDCVLDIGSGTGNLTYELAKRVQPEGQIYAIEPDAERMKIAKQQQPNELNNIIWHEGTLETFAAPQMPLFTIAYSNYVLHWIKNQRKALQIIFDNLMSGGRFVFCCVFDMPPLIRDLCEAIGPEGHKITAALHFIPKEQWLEYFTSVGFRLDTINEVPDYEFNRIEDVMTWWEATTHGVFSINKLTPDVLQKLKKDYPGKISIYRNETLRLLATKSNSPGE